MSVIRDRGAMAALELTIGLSSNWLYPILSLVSRRSKLPRAIAE